MIVYNNDITGQRFIRLLVVEQLKERKHGSVMYRCMCDCGNELSIRRDALTSGNTRSCGCLQKEVAKEMGRSMRTRFLGEGEAAFLSLYRSYKKGAVSRGYDFELDITMFRELTSRHCFYCGIPPIQEFKSLSKTGSYIYNGIDRIDNSIGYTIGNCVPCCKSCNYLKGSRNRSEFLELVRRIYEYSIQKT